MAGHREFDKLNNTNFQPWKYRMEMLLVKQDLWEVVTRDPNEPLPVNPLRLRALQKKQAAARAEIALRVDDTQLIYTRQPDPALIWTTLETVHQARGMATRMSMRREFHLMEKVPDENMQAWIARVQDAGYQLRELGANIDDEEIILVLTQSLKEEYESLIVSLDGLGSELTLSVTVTRLLNEARRQGEESTIVRHKEENKAHMSYVGRANPSSRRNKPERRTPIENITCFNCGKKGHYASSCTEAEKNNKESSAMLLDLAY